MDKYLPGIQHMNEIAHSLNALIVIVIGAIGSGFVAYIYQWRVSLPRRFEQQTKEREAQLDNLREEFENKHAAEAVDIERERMLPLMFQNNQRLHGEQIEENTEKLEGVETKLGVVEDKVEKLSRRLQVLFPRDSNILDLFDQLKVAVEETKSAVGEKKRGDSQPIPSVTVPVDKGTILITGVLPDDLDLKPTGTG